MAARTDDAKCQDELNFIFKSLGKREREVEKVKEIADACMFISVQMIMPIYNKNSEHCLDIWPCGSEDRNSGCQEHDDAGDVSIVIFPNSDNLIIPEELLEYSFENPLHVKIKGEVHSVLRSCLAEDKEYVATTAVKNFHPAIYGSPSSYLVHVLPSVSACSLQLSQQLPLLIQHFAKHHSTIFNPRNVSSFYAAQWEWGVVAVCKFIGIDYTRQHAERLTENFLQFLIELFVMTPQNKDFSYGFRHETFRTLFMSAAVHSNDQQLVTPESGDKHESRRMKKKDSREALPSTDDVLYVTPQNRDDSQKPNEDMGSTSSVNSHFQVSERQGEDEKSENKKNGDLDENQKRSKNERQTKPMKREITTLPTKIFDHYTDHLLGAGTARKGDSFHEQQKRRIDLIPALRFQGWPKVAEDWIKRERKWPSPEMVARVIQEGCHIVVKPTHNSDNPDGDFRISFSHAEWLLRQEMNEIQRECFCCLKKYHRAFLSTHPESLVMYHLKNIFLQTIEETGAEMWTEDNRVECMMKLLGNLLEALTKKDLRHFFVRSCNLFGVHYNENPAILESLVEIIEKIMENPMQFSKELIRIQENTKQVSKEDIPSIQPTCRYATPNTEKQHSESEGNPSKGNEDTQTREEKLLTDTTQSKFLMTNYRYHDLKEIFISTTTELIDMAFNDANCRLQTLDPAKKLVVIDLRDLVCNCDFSIEALPELLCSFWDRVYFTGLVSTETDVRHHMLVQIHEVLKNSGISDRRFVGNSLDFSHFVPPGTLTQLVCKTESELLDLYSAFTVQPQVVSMDDIPLD